MLLPIKFLIFTIILSRQHDCARILGIFHISGISHYRAGVSLMKILADKGHEVTVVAPHGEKNPPENYRSVVVDSETLSDEKGEEIFKSLSKEITLWHKLLAPHTVHRRLFHSVENTLKHPEFQKLMKSNETFDLVILEDFVATALKYAAYHFKAPLITFAATGLNSDVASYLGNPDNPAYTTHYQLEFGSEKNFFQRLISSIHYAISKLVFNFIIIPSHDELLHRYFPDAPHVNDLNYNASLAFINEDISIFDPLPRVPNVISIGGYFIKKPEPLPNDLQQLLDNSTNGVIYFSLGTNYKSKYLPKHRIDLILRVFGERKETVLWKYEEQLSGTPKNVIIQKWFPQNDILAHRNVKLLIFHGGIFSLMEGVYHGLPMLAFPLFGDQQANIRRADAAGYAKWMKIDELTEENLHGTIEELITNPEYEESAKRKSLIMRDKQISLEDTITYWVDYVIKHKGASHLRVAALNLKWHQYLLLDVIAFILVCVIFSVIIVMYLIKFIAQIRARKTLKTD